MQTPSKTQSDHLPRRNLIDTEAVRFRATFTQSRNTFLCQQSGLTASDPLSAARFRRQLAASDFSEREVAEDVMSALAREDVLSVPTPRIRRQWRQKRWFRKRWEALMKARAKRYR